MSENTRLILRIYLSCVSECECIYWRITFYFYIFILHYIIESENCHIMTLSCCKQDREVPF